MKKVIRNLHILSLLTVFLFASCDNFLSSDVVEEVKETLDYNNAAKVFVNVKADIPESGTFLEDGKIECRLGYKQDIAFIPAPGYVFLGWKVVNREDNNLDLDDAVRFDTVTAAKTKFTVLYDSNILIKPLVAENPRVETFLPEYSDINPKEHPKNSNIQIIFNHELDNAEENLDLIEVTAGGVKVTDKFTASVNGRTIRLDAKDSDFIDLKSGTQQVFVKIPPVFTYTVKNIAGTSVTLKMDEVDNRRYIINSSTINQLRINYPITISELGKLNIPLGERPYNGGDYETVEFKPNAGYKVCGWNVTSSSLSDAQIKDYIEVTKSEDDTENLNTTINISVKKVNTTGTIQVEPIVYKEIALTDSTVPAYSRIGVPRSSTIKLYLTQPLSSNCDLSKISIAVDGKLQDENKKDFASYYEASVDDSRKVITFTSKELLPIELGDTKDVVVTIPEDFTYDVAANYTEKADKEIQHSFVVNSSTEQKAEITIVTSDESDKAGNIKISGETRTKFEKSLSISDTEVIIFQLKEGYNFAGWKVEGNEDLVFLSDQVNIEGYSYVEGKNYSYNPSTSSYAVKVRALKSGKCTIKPETTEIPNRSIIVTADKGNVSPNGQSRYYEGAKIPLIYNPDSDYSFSHWVVMMGNNDVTDKDYIKFETSSQQLKERGKENYDRNAVAVFKEAPSSDVILTIKPVYYIRPQICSYTPSYDAKEGAYRDSRIMIMFDHDMDAGSIYYTEDEIKALFGKDGQFKYDENDSSYTVDNKNYKLLVDTTRNNKIYGYEDLDGQRYYKNIRISNFRNKSQSYLKYYMAPYFETPDVLIIPAYVSAKKTASDVDDSEFLLPKNAQLYVEILEDMYYLADDENVTMGSARKWNYNVSGRIDNTPPTVSRFLIKGIDKDDNLRELALTASDLAAAYNKESGVYINVHVEDDGCGPESIKFYYKRLQSEYSTETEEEVLSQNFEEIDGSNGYIGEYQKDITTEAYKAMQSDKDNYLFVDMSKIFKEKGIYSIRVEAQDSNGNAVECGKKTGYVIYYNTDTPNSITGLRAEPKSNKEIELTWVNPTTGSSWDIHKYYYKDTTKTDNTNWIEIPVEKIVYEGAAADSNTVSKITVNALNPSHKYEFRVDTYDSEITGHSNENKVTIVSAAKPNPATDLTVTRNKDNPQTSLDVKWTNPTDSDTYASIRVIYKAEGESTASVYNGEITEETSSVTLTDLKPGTNYIVDVVTLSTGELSTDSVSSSRVTAPNAAIVNSVVRNTSNSQNITLGWTNPVSGKYDGLKILYATRSNPSAWTVWDGTVSKSATTATVTGLTAGTPYHFRVVTYVDGWTNISDTNATQSNDSDYCYTKPNAPTNVTIVRNQNNPKTALDVSWNAPATGLVSGYRIIYKGSNETSEKYIDIKPTARLETTLSNLAPGINYTVKVYAYSDNWITATSNNVALGTGTTQCYTRPEAVTGITEAAATVSSMSINWVGVAASGYKIVTYKDAAGTDKVSEVPATADATSKDINSLNICSTYYVKIVSYAGTEDNASTSSLVGPFYTKPSSVTNLKVDNNTKTSVTLSWTNPASDKYTGLNVYYGTSSDPTTLWNKDSNLGKTSTSTTITGLTPGVQYYFKVVTYNTNTTSLNSNKSEVVNTYTKPNTVTNLTVAQNTTDPLTKLNVSWTNPTGSNWAGVKVYYGTSANPTTLWTTITDKTTTSTTITGLTPGQTYYVRVVTYNGTFSSIEALNSSDASDSSCITKPNVVTNVQVSQNDTNLNVSWTNPTAGNWSGVKVYYGTSANPTTLRKDFDDKTTTSTTITGLTPGQTYYVRVVTYNGTFSSITATNSNVTGNYSCTTKPAKVTNLSVSQNSSYPDTRLNVSWTNPTSGNWSGVKVYYGTSANPTTLLNTYTDKTTTSTTITGLTPGQTYYVRVVTYNGTFSSITAANSNVTSDTSCATKPAKVTNLNVSQNSSYPDTRLNVSWTNPTSGNWTGVKIYYGTSTNPTTLLNTYTDKTTTSTTITGLTPGQTYYVRVVTYNGTFSSITAANSNVTGNYSCTTKPAKVTNLTVSQNSSYPDTRLDVSWTNPTSGNWTGVNVYYGTATNPTKLWKDFDDKTTTSTTITGLTPGQTYYVRVVTYNGEFSSIIDTNTNATSSYSCTTKPAKVTNLKVSQNSSYPDTRLNVSWTNPTSGNWTGVKVYYGTSTNPTTLLNTYTNKTTTSTTITGLTPGQTYYVRVVTYDGIFSSITAANSNVTSDTSCATKPAKVTNLKVTPNPTNPLTELDVSWTNPTQGNWTGVKVYYGTSANPATSCTTITNKTTTSTTITGLTAGIDYYVRVVTYNGTFSSITAANSNVTTDVKESPKPNPVRSVSVANNATYPSDRLNISWTAPSSGSVDGYAVYCSSSSTIPSSPSTTTTSTSATLTNLRPNSGYYIWVCTYKDVVVNSEKVRVYSTAIPYKNSSSAVVPYYTAFAQYDEAKAQIYNDDGMGHLRLKIYVPNVADLAYINVYLDSNYKTCINIKDNTSLKGNYGYVNLTIPDFKLNQNYTIGTTLSHYKNMNGLELNGEQNTVTYKNTYGYMRIKGTIYADTQLKPVITSSLSVVRESNAKGQYPWNNNNSDLRYSAFNTSNTNYSGSSVTLQPYNMGAFEVRNDIYKAIMGTSPSVTNTDAGAPVDSVTFYDAILFCNRLSAAMGLTPVYKAKVTSTSAEVTDWTSGTVLASYTVNETAKGFRIPSWAQWECAARGGNPNDTTNWGSYYSGAKDGGYNDTKYRNPVAWNTSNAGSKTHTTTETINNKTPNSLGLYNMSGNVWEWTSTPMVSSQSNYGSNRNVILGGGFGNGTRCGVWCTGRTSGNDDGDSDTGFRICCLR